VTLAHRIVDTLLEDDELDSFVRSAGVDIIHRWEWRSVYKNDEEVPKPSGVHSLRFKAGDSSGSGAIFFQVYYYGENKAMHISPFEIAVAPENDSLWNSELSVSNWISKPREFWIDPKRYEEFRIACLDLVRDHILPTIALPNETVPSWTAALRSPVDALIRKFMLKGTPRKYVSGYVPPSV
jgi:hypothetical protein